MRKRTLYSLAAAVLVLCALAVAFVLRQHAPPEVARLLPESDAIVYLNLKPLRAATHFDRSPVTPSPGYQQFIDATGIQFERDLDKAAFALHRMADPSGPNGPVAFSEVFQGRFDTARLTRYLTSLSVNQENYAGRTIYLIPSEGRNLRVALLDYDTIAASNMPSPEQIHSILDRYRSAALPFSGSSLLSEHYPEIPLLSMAWGIGKIPQPLDPAADFKVMGMTIPIPANATYLASIRWTGSLHLRVEEIASDDASATNTAESLDSMLTLGKAATNESSASSSGDADLRTLLNSIAIQHRRNRAILTATVPPAVLQRLTESTTLTAPVETPAPR